MDAPRWIPLIALTLALASAAPASASTVSLSGGLLNYTAGPSEANVLVISVSGTITDAPDVSISAGAGCSNPEGDNTASCSGLPVQYFVDVADLDDSVDTSGIGPPGISEIRGGSGNDAIVAGAGPEDVKGEQGDDVLLGGPGADLFFGGPGKDVVRYTEVTRDSSIPVTASLNTLTDDGAAGESDNVNTDGTVENLTGGAENDTFTGSVDDNLLRGQNGNDTLNGGGGNDVLEGGRGTDVFNGGSENDVLADSDNLLTSDTYAGGPGADVVDYSVRPSAVVVDLTDPATDGSAGEGDAITDVEGAVGTPGDDRLIGDGGAGSFDGRGGNDFVDGRGGADAMTGGSGVDTVSYASHSGAVTADLAGGAANDGEPSEGDNIAGDFETLSGGSGPDALTGGPGPDTLTGAAGDDVLIGNAGSDDMSGDDGADQLAGDAGNDHLVGGAGADGIDAGAGDDSLRIRDGEADTVRCAEGFDSVIGDPVDGMLDACESFDDGTPRPVPPPAGGGQQQQPGQQQPASDTRAPSLTLDRLPRTMRRATFMKGVRLGIACDEACAVQAELRGTPRQTRLARYELSLGSRSLGLATQKRTVRVRPSRRLVGRSRRFTVQVRVTATDAAGNRTSRNVVIRVR